MRPSVSQKPSVATVSPRLSDSNHSEIYSFMPPTQAKRVCAVEPGEHATRCPLGSSV